MLYSKEKEVIFMKKALTILIFIMTLSIFTGCSGRNNKPDDTIKDETIENQTDPSLEKMPEDMKTMAEPADSLLMCMVENNITYDPADSTFFWKALYYFAGIYGPSHTLAEVDENGVLKLPRQTLREYASTLFADYDDLLAIPPSMNSSIEYNSDWDAYILSTGDRGLSQSEITVFADNGDGTYTITVELKGTVENDLIAKGRFKLVKNEYTDGITEPTYFYSIASAEII